ncbi:MAG: trigger factor [Thermomicrobiales bacterium]|nr:trigger factor [Thermomicrobiales bacterium]MCO5221836.1 trigger factor [Thermomicrobiales bacterium]
MKVTIERIPESQVRLDIAADPDEQNEAIEKAYRRVAREVVIPGFRKGKAPRSMIERYFGREMVVEEANRKLLDDLYRKAIEQEDLVPVGDPELESIEPEPLQFTVTVPVYPAVDPGNYLDVRVDPADASLEEDAVDEVLEALRTQQSPWVDPAEERTAQDGDQITVDIAITENGEEFQPPTEDATFELGETTFLAELVDLVKTLKAGESGSADITFAEDRVDAGDPRTGKTLTYTLNLTGIKQRDLLPLDDEFAKTYASAENLDEVRDRIRTNLHIEKTRETRTEVVNSIVEKIVEGATLELPAPMIEEQIDRQVQRAQRELSMQGVPWEGFLRQIGQTEDEWRESVRENAAETLTSSLVLREIAEKEGIEVSENDLIAEIEQMVAQSDQAQQAQTRQAYLSNEYLRNVIRNELYDQKLTQRLIDIATEGGDVVLNGYVAPEGVELEVDEAAETAADDAVTADTESLDSTE